jgi:hypothetical protein
MSDDNDFDASQEQLGRALEQARMGEDRDLAGWVRERGERFVRLLYGLLRMTALHDLENLAFTKPINDITVVIGELMEVLGALHLVTVEDQIFINDIRIRLGKNEDSSNLGEELRRHEIGGVSLHAPPTPAQMRTLVALFAGKPESDSPRARLISSLTEGGVDQIDLFGVFRFRVSGEEEQKQLSRHDLDRISTRASELVDESWENLTADRMPNPLPMRRIVTEILESGSGGDALWEEPSGASPYGAHALQVCRLALIIAHGAELSSEAIQDIGVCAMFHDAGYAAREGADPKSGDPGYAPPFERHAAAGARILLRQRGFHQAKIARALSTLEHHRDHSDPRGRPMLYSRILRIAEDYSNLTRRTAGGMAPVDALQRMASCSGSAYDPTLLQIFINCLGAYPPGTLLELQGGYIVISRSLVRSPETFDRPLARLMRAPDGSEPARKMSIDLATRKIRILRVLRDLPPVPAAT